MNYNLSINDQGEGEVTFVHEGLLVTVPHSHPNFKLIVNCLLSGTDPTEFLSVKTAVEALGERVTLVDDNTILFDGQEIDNRLTRTILRYRAEGRDTEGLVKFLERLQQNPSRHSRTQLFDWVSDRDLTIDSEGYFVAWKGVNPDNSSVDPQEADFEEGADVETLADAAQRFLSATAGTAWVNGTKHEGLIPNFVGAVVSMPRDEVEDDPSTGCSHGLHVGTFDYAKGFAQKLLEVRVDPADVVSVPRDSYFQKLRCCRYEVLAVQDIPTPDLSRWEPEPTIDVDTEVFTGLEQAQVPPTFLQRLKLRLLGGGRDEE